MISEVRTASMTIQVNSFVAFWVLTALAVVVTGYKSLEEIMPKLWGWCFCRVFLFVFFII